MLMPHTHPSFSNRNDKFTDEALVYIHSTYSSASSPLDFIQKLKLLMVSLMHYEKAAQLRDIEKTILNGFKWTL